MREYGDLSGINPLELFEDHIQWSKNLKEYSAAKGEKALDSVVSGWRDDEMVLTVSFAPDRDPMLWANEIALKIFGCEWVFTCYETWQASVQENPMTGKPWQQGEMQFVVENFAEENREHLWVVDALTIMMITREGRQLMVNKKFVQDGEKVTWLDDPETGALLDNDDEEIAWGGSVYDFFVKVIDDLKEEDKYANVRRSMPKVVADAKEDDPDQVYESLIALLDHKTMSEIIRTCPFTVAMALTAAPNTVRSRTLDEISAKEHEGIRINPR